MNDRLSTRWTIAYWAGAFSFVAIAIPTLWRMRRAVFPMDLAEGIMLVFIMALLAWQTWMMLSFMHVTATEEGLIVRGLFRSASIRYDELAEVRSLWWPRITVLRLTTRSGRRYDFVPYFVWSVLPQAHPALKRLRERIAV